MWNVPHCHKCMLFRGEAGGERATAQSFHSLLQTAEECLSLLDGAPLPCLTPRWFLAAQRGVTWNRASEWRGGHRYPSAVCVWPVCPPRWWMWRCCPRARRWLHPVLRHRKTTFVTKIDKIQLTTLKNKLDWPSVEHINPPKINCPLEFNLITCFLLRLFVCLSVSWLVNRITQKLLDRLSQH